MPRPITLMDRVQENIGKIAGGSLGAFAGGTAAAIGGANVGNAVQKGLQEIENAQSLKDHPESRPASINPTQVPSVTQASQSEAAVARSEPQASKENLIPLNSLLLNLNSAEKLMDREIRANYTCV